jgi:hypothetical protein
LLSDRDTEYPFHQVNAWRKEIPETISHHIGRVTTKSNRRVHGFGEVLFPLAYRKKSRICKTRQVRRLQSVDNTTLSQPLVFCKANPFRFPTIKSRTCSEENGIGITKMRDKHSKEYESAPSHDNARTSNAMYTEELYDESTLLLGKAKAYKYERAARTELQWREDCNVKCKSVHEYAIQPVPLILRDLVKSSLLEIIISNRNVSAPSHRKNKTLQSLVTNIAVYLHKVEGLEGDNIFDSTLQIVETILCTHAEKMIDRYICTHLQG